MHGRDVIAPEATFKFTKHQLDKFIKDIKDDLVKARDKNKELSIANIELRLKNQDLTREKENLQKQSDMYRYDYYASEEQIKELQAKVDELMGRGKT